jgi:hypothetical protein
MELYRVLTHTTILNWLNVLEFIPFVNLFLTPAIAIWGIIVNFVAIKWLYRLSTAKTIWVILIPDAIFSSFLIAMSLLFLPASPVSQFQ